MSDEDDLSAEETAESEGSWFSFQNEYRRRKKGTSCPQVKREKKINSLIF